MTKRPVDNNAIVELMNVRFAALEKLIDLRFDTAAVAVLKAEDQMNRRLEGMNEFRDTLKDQASHFVTRSELEIVTKDISKLQLSEATLAGKASQTSVNTAYLFTGIGIALAIASLLMRLIP